jgi:hypothetical protein
VAVAEVSDFVEAKAVGGEQYQHGNASYGP